MSGQYRCNKRGYIPEMKDVMCADVHWDCKIAQLEAELKITPEVQE